MAHSDDGPWSPFLGEAAAESTGPDSHRHLGTPVDGGADATDRTTPALARDPRADRVLRAHRARNDSRSGGGWMSGKRQWFRRPW
jgi:hypothetical protein